MSAALKLPGSDYRGPIGPLARALEVPRQPAIAINRQRGTAQLFHDGETNRCPACGRSHWWMGRSTAECAFCAAAIPLAHPAPQLKEI